MPGLTGPVVAGIPLVQEVLEGVPFTTAGGEAWSDPALIDPAARPIQVRHRVGSVPAVPGTLLVDAPPPMGRCYVDAAGHLAVANEPIFEPRGAQLLTTVDDGEAYELTHSLAAVAAYYQWLWQRTIVTYALASRGRGLMAHACGVRLPDGGVILCPGASGTGKSTIATLLAEEMARRGHGASVLSDDRVAITADGAGVRAWGTPWHSSAGHATPGGGPLRALVFVRHGSGAEVRRAAPPSVMPRVLPAVALPFWSGALLATALAFLERVVAGTPAVEFTYAPAHPGAAGALLDALERPLAGEAGS